MANLKPDAVIIVATVRALKYNGGVAKADLNEENLEALEKGIPNLLKHVENITQVYKLPAVVAINEFPTDTEAEVELVRKKCQELGVNVALSQVWAKGGEGGIELAKEVIRLCDEPNDFQFCYPDEYEMGIYPMQEGDIVEIDSLEELVAVDGSYKSVLEEANHE